MEFKATLKYTLLSPKKVWRISRELRGLTYKSAMEYLRELAPKPARAIEKLLKSCFYNGLQKDANLAEEDLVIHEIHVSKGTFIKRLSPRAQGRADIIRKPTSHISVILTKKEQ